MSTFSVVINQLSKVIRTSGQALDKVGRLLEVNPYVETLQPSTKVVKLGKNSPVIDASFLASTASVIGKVSIGKKSSVWYGAIVRGDINPVSIGDNTVIGDRVMVHVSRNNKPAIIGNSVFIGTGAIIHGSTVEDECVIGEGAQVLDGAVVKKNAKVAAGSIVTKGKVVPSGELWSGAPAVFQRNLTEQEKQFHSTIISEYANLAVLHAKESSKSYLEVEADELRNEAASYGHYEKKLSEEEISRLAGEVNFHEAPGRIFNSNLRVKVEEHDR